MPVEPRQRPTLGLTETITCRIRPETKAALDATGTPSSMAGSILDEWAETHRPAADESERAEEGAPAKGSPGRRSGAE